MCPIELDPVQLVMAVYPTIRASWADKHTACAVQCINGIDGVGGMQYINTAYMIQSVLVCIVTSHIHTSYVEYDTPYIQCIK